MAKRKAWFAQLKRHVEQYGAAEAAWYAFWRDPDGKLKSKSCGAGAKGKRDAERLADRRHSELVTGTYRDEKSTSWESFRKRYDTAVLSQMGEKSRRPAILSLGHFERIVKPGRVDRITSETIEQFTAIRRVEACGRNAAKTVTVATVNQCLRYVKMALRTAHEWGLLPKVPRIRMIREPQRLPTFITDEHFAALYEAAAEMDFPDYVPNVSPADWWRGILIFAYLTGWRIGQILALTWADVDLEAGTAITRADDNKGKRDQKVPLHPELIRHLAKLKRSFQTEVFPLRAVDRVQSACQQFRLLQSRATLADGSPFPSNCGKHGGWYGWHDLRRAFATANAGSMSLFELQRLMQHADLQTTQRYVSMADKLRPAVQKLHVPLLSSSCTG